VFLQIQWDTSLQISTRFNQARNNFRGPCFVEIVVCAVWNIWNERNGHILKNQSPSLTALLDWLAAFATCKNVLPYVVSFSVLPSLM
jgi:hypothetical protein